jgi:biopolymer transport protein TolR
VASVDSGKKGDMDFEINLIPFIDLMSMNISFLLITAVWTQVSMIQIGSSIYGKRNDTGQVEQPQKPTVNLKVDINSQGYVVNAGKQSFVVPKKGDAYDPDGLTSYLKDFKAKFPEKTDGILSMLDDIKYDELIRGMDAMMSAGFPELAIATQGVK